MGREGYGVLRGDLRGGSGPCDSSGGVGGYKTAEAAFPGKNGKIAFQSDRDGNAEIYRMNPDGSNQQNITNNPASDVVPDWSPDSKKIAFSSNRDGPSNSEILRMNPDGSNQQRLTNNPASDTAPDWQPLP